MKKINDLILLLFMFIGIGLIRCDNDNDISIDTPPEDWIIGTWRSEYNDSIKFISDSTVFINSLCHNYQFINDSIELHLLCDSEIPPMIHKYEFARI